MEQYPQSALKFVIPMYSFDIPAIPGRFHRKRLLSGTFMITCLRKALALPDLKGLTELRLFLTKSSRRSHAQYFPLPGVSSLCHVIQAIPAILTYSRLGLVWDNFRSLRAGTHRYRACLRKQRDNKSPIYSLSQRFWRILPWRRKDGNLSSPANRANWKPFVKLRS